MATIQTREQARMLAVLRPAEANLLLMSVWPPQSEQDLAAAARVARMVGVLAPDSQETWYVNTRIAHVRQYLETRRTRYGAPDTWSVQTSTGRVIRMPLGEPPAAAFKKLVDDAGGGYERTLIAYLRGHLGPRSVFVDVGAHVGYISAMAADTGAAVFALEMQRELIPLIEQMAAINGFDLVRPLNVGVSATAGISPVKRADASPGAQLEGALTRQRVLDPRSLLDDLVPTVSLDDLFDHDGLVPTVVKLDVEGHEVGVLDGARRLIAQRRTCFAVEYHPHLVTQYGRTGAELFGHFPLQRWKAWQLDDTGLTRLGGIADVRPDRLDPNPKLVFEPK
jgi:FkbM family methyltransferase